MRLLSILLIPEQLKSLSVLSVCPSVDEVIDFCNHLQATFGLPQYFVQYSNSISYNKDYSCKSDVIIFPIGKFLNSLA
jgi:hypothetical protein